MKKIVFCFFFAFAFVSASEDASGNYLDIVRHYINWQNALFGSQNFHRRELVSLLLSLNKKNIKTGYDYVLFYPSPLDEKRYNCKFNLYSGLKIEVLLPVDKVNKIKGELTSSLWKSRQVISISGKLRKFFVTDWISSSIVADNVVIFLDDADIDVLSEK